MRPDERLAGTWRMVSWKRESVATGEQSDALGPDPVGFINYGADGRFYAIVVRRDRAPPLTFPYSEREKAVLFDSMLAYAGTYTLDEEKVVHHVDASWNQSWTGTDQVRFYGLDGDQLFITAAKAPDPYTGEDVVHKIRFEKIRPSAEVV
jgi:hypothetical protein